MAVGAAEEGHRPHQAESVGFVAVVRWKSGKRCVLEGKVRWFVHKELCEKVRADT